MGTQVDEGFARAQQAQLVGVTPGGGTVDLTVNEQKSGTGAHRAGGVVGSGFSVRKIVFRYVRRATRQGCCFGLGFIALGCAQAKNLMIHSRLRRFAQWVVLRNQ